MCFFILPISVHDLRDFLICPSKSVTRNTVLQNSAFTVLQNSGTVFVVMRTFLWLFKYKSERACYRDFRNVNFFSLMIIKAVFLRVLGRKSAFPAAVETLCYGIRDPFSSLNVHFFNQFNTNLNGPLTISSEIFTKLCLIKIKIK